VAHPEKAVSAYVMLRSMEGKERLIYAYKDSWLRRQCLSSCCCCRYSKYQKMM